MTMNIPPELERLMREAVERDASDLFLIPGEPATFRVNGLIERLERDPFTAQEITGIAVAIFGNENLTRVGNETGVIRRSCQLDDQIYGRVSLARAYGDYTISVARVGMAFMGVDELRLPTPMVDAILAPNGLVVLCGGVGSGVYTCAYSLLDHHNAQCADHICTVEPMVFGRMIPKRSFSRYSSRSRITTAAPLYSVQTATCTWASATEAAAVTRGGTGRTLPRFWLPSCAST